jgi:hypothetical protein
VLATFVGLSQSSFPLPLAFIETKGCIMSMFIISGDCSRSILPAEGVAEVLCDSLIFPECPPEGFVRFSVVRYGGDSVYLVTIGDGERLIPAGSTIDECAAAVHSAIEGL